jgi:hypothetical protein
VTSSSSTSGPCEATPPTSPADPRRGHHPGGFENYFRELGELLAAGHASVPAQAGADTPLHDSDAFTKLAEKYHITYGNPPWLDDVVTRYGLNRPTH